MLILALASGQSLPPLPLCWAAAIATVGYGLFDSAWICWLYAPGAAREAVGVCHGSVREALLFSVLALREASPRNGHGLSLEGCSALRLLAERTPWPHWHRHQAFRHAHRTSTSSQSETFTTAISP